MSNGEGIHLNGDKKWLEQLLNEKFGRIEDKMDTFKTSLDEHQKKIFSIEEQHENCRNEMQQQVWTLLGKEQGLNAAYNKQNTAKEFSFKRMAIYFSTITVILNILFFLFRNWYFYK
jgi:hypothetical protein